MKEIKIWCQSDGTIKTQNKVVSLSGENESVLVTIDFGGLEDSNLYTKRADIFVSYDETIDYEIGMTNDILSFYLSNAHLKQGFIRIQPIAYIDGDGDYETFEKEKWESFKVKVEPSINASESTVNVSNSLGQDLIIELADHENRIQTLENIDLSMLSNVYISDPQNGDVLKYNATTNVWYNAQP
jgi:hypothetical protein